MPSTPELLEVGSHGLTAILATWLGATVASRSRGSHSAHVFAWLSFLLVAWSTSIVIERLSPSGLVRERLNLVENAAAFLLPAATLHIVAALTSEGWPTLPKRVALVAAYAICGAVALHAVVDPSHPLNIEGPRYAVPGIAGPLAGWGWVVARVAIFVLAIGWSYQGFQGAGRGTARRGQMAAVAIAVAIASIGGTLRFMPRQIGGPNWVGVSLVTLGLLFAVYGVMAQGVFLAPVTARQALRYSLLTGVGVAAYVGALIGIEAGLDRALQLDLPVLSGLVLVATIAFFEPVRDRVQRLLRRSASDRDVARLRRAMQPTALARQAPERAIQPLLERVSDALGMRGAEVATPEGTILAQRGSAVDRTPVISMVLKAGDRIVGNALFGSKATGLPYTPAETALLRDAADYMTATIELGDEEKRQARALSQLATREAEVASRGSELQNAIARTESEAPGLRVFALGPLVVERGSRAIQHWGGQHAGSRQAEAIFAFLFDRGERGATKDEVLEVVWPDVDLERADLAFHRTLVGLRGVLQPGRRVRAGGDAIGFHNDRYRLHPSLVEWSDVAAFEDYGAAPTDADERLERLEEARRLYRGDYLDDCPFYGDSEYVESRRSLLRGRYVDVLIALGEAYERRGDRTAATARFREAMIAAGGDCAPAAAGLERLGAATAIATA